MRFKERTDIAVRMLMQLALLKGRKISIDDLVEFDVGHRSQIVAAIQELRKAGMVASSSGRNGGIWIARDPSTINIADVIQMFETDFHLTKCFSDPESCDSFPDCRFKVVLEEALECFFGSLRKTTVADLVPDVDVGRQSVSIPDD